MARNLKTVTTFAGNNHSQQFENDRVYFARIINDRNWSRLNNMLMSTKGKILVGGETDQSDKYIAPTIISGVSPEEPLMKEEIFGPILPIMNISSPEQAVQFINSRPKPLSLYVFSTNKATQNLIKSETSSGSLVMNDAVVHLSVETLPFGGVGDSGMGSYHGRYTFTTFSHEKSVLVRDFSRLDH